MRLLRHSFALCAFLLLCSASMLQSQILRGIVRDASSNKPLSGARVLLLETRRGALSGADGSFRLPSTLDAQTLRITLLGYQTLEKRVESGLQDTITLDIRLKPSAVRLRAARVETERLTSENMPTQNVTTVAGQELERLRGQTLGEALQNVAGITLLQTGASVAKPVIRGLHSQRVIVVNAGVAQEGQQWGAEHAPEIDPFAAQRIELVRGAAGVEYGAGAIGGVIRVEPRHIPHGDWFGGKALMTLFSNNSQGALSLALEGGRVEIGEKNSIVNSLGNGFGWRVQGSARKAGDSRAPAYAIGNTGFQEINGSAAFGYTGEKFSIEAYYSLFTTELGIFRGAHIGNLNDLLRAIEAGKPLVDYDWTYSIRNPKQQISHDLWSVKAKLDAGFGQFEMQYGWQQNNRAEFDSHNARIRGDSGLLLASLERPAMTLQLTTYSLDAKFRHKPLEIWHSDTSSSALTGVIGTSGMAQWNVQGGRTFLIPSFQAESAGLYAIETLTTPDFTANLGLRYDAKHIAVRGSSSRSIPDTTQVFTGFSAAAGVKYEFQRHKEEGKGIKAEDSVSTPKTNNQKQTTLALNLGMAWRAPLVNEQFSLGVHHGTAQYEIGNSRLQPERSYSADLTLSHVTETLRFELSGYANGIENFIYLRPDAANPTVTIRGTFPTFFHTQTFALLTGADASIDAVLVKFSQNNSLWRIGGTASLVRGTNITDREPLIFMPADRVRAFVRFEMPSLAGMENIFVEAASLLVRTQDRFPQNVDYTVPPAGYVLFDVSLGCKVEALGTRFSWSIAARNLANTPFRDYLSRYRYFTDDAGRNVILRLSVPFGDGR
ncbi:MAG: TonB-dependent receptor [Candidatus Kapaibacterium sp.]|nr:MAG: TonB-dependent receptor [Candidatus Kapabacteria bacterium]